MKFTTFKYDNSTAQAAIFPEGRSEAHAIIHAEAGLTFEEQLGSVVKATELLADDLGGLAPVFKRYFLSDSANQADKLPTEEPCAVSRIQQPPLDGSKIAVWCVFQAEGDFKNKGNGLWEDSQGRIIAGDAPAEAGNSHDLTVKRLADLADTLGQRGASLLNNCVRTWFMVRDVDLNYAGVVVGRNEEFSRRGLTRDTHFITSTGIEGRPVNQAETVAFNAVCDTKLVPGQMGYVYGASHLNSTIEYGVAFERGTTVDYRDRRHVYISGTASIDNKGQVVHPGNIKAQTRRMIENIEVLLAEAGCDRNDLAHLIVYLRDISDYQSVKEIYDELMPEVPKMLVHAPVCRPGWLVETECMAIKKAEHPLYEAF